MKKITLEEAINRIKEANSLLKLYKEVLNPVLEFLADDASVEIYGKEGKMCGQFGWHEAGVDCLHFERVSRDHDDNETYFHKIQDWNSRWDKTLGELRCGSLYIDAH